MSIIAALLLQAAAVAPRPVTAREALAAHRAATSIGPDPCRPGAAEEEIVVCARLDSPYALPLYDPDDGNPDAEAGGGRERQMAAVRETVSACAAHSFDCRPPPAVDFFTLVPVVIKAVVKGVQASTDDE